MTETQLIQQCRQGNQTAFNALIDAHYANIYRLCHRFLGNAMDAEEAAQDVFIQFYQAIDRYQPEAKLSTYLYKLAVNRSLNGLRTRKRQRLLPFSSKQEEKNEWAGDEGDRPDLQLEQDERALAVRKAIDSLPENQRTAVILQRFHDLPYEEIAKIMGCSVSSVESRLHRAKQSLSKKLNYLKN